MPAYDRKIKQSDDNPTIGILLCAEKNDAVVEFTLPEDNKQIFAKKYQLHLPTIDQLKTEIQREYQEAKFFLENERSDEL